MKKRALARCRFLASLFLLAGTVPLDAALQISREQSDRLARKIEVLNKNAEAKPVRAKTTAVSEPEINSYLAFNVAQQIPRGLTHPEIRLGADNQLAGRIYVDIDEFKRGRASGGLADPFNYISGQVPVTARGMLRTQEGIGRFQFASAELYGVPLPKPLVQELVSFFSRTPERPNGINMDQPFELPAKIRSITVARSEALVVQ